MKFLKLYEDFDFNEDDFDFEEDFEVGMGEYKIYHHVDYKNKSSEHKSYYCAKDMGNITLNVVTLKNGKIDFFNFPNFGDILIPNTEEDNKYVIDENPLINVLDSNFLHYDDLMIRLSELNESKDIDWDDFDDEEIEYFDEKYIIFGYKSLHDVGVNFIGKIIDRVRSRYKIKLIDGDIIDIYDLTIIDMIVPDSLVHTAPTKMGVPTNDKSLSFSKMVMKYPNAVSVSTRSIKDDILKHPEKYLTKG